MTENNDTPNSTPPEGVLVWIDMEMSGLNPETDRILEMATIVTDNELNILAQGPELVIHQDDEVLDAMDDWNKSHHGGSGLVDKVKASTIDDAAAEAETLKFLKEYCLPGKSPICGNSVWQDRRFIARYMKKLDKFLHYRCLDVSTIKELSTRWYPANTFSPPEKKEAHRALEDIKESIAELAYYKEALFIKQKPKAD